jgi:molybdopterin/thiamine biosynthesis adenylyltransferase
MNIATTNPASAFAPFIIGPVSTTAEHWTYEEAFARNAGLISTEGQQKLRNACIAIPGMGGVGGVHLVTLARLGVGSFHIADRDEYSVANFNRQYGARTDTLGACKATTMAGHARAINPNVNLKVVADHITRENVDEFLDGVDILLDGVDFFSIEARRMLFREARKRGIWAVTAGPIGFSTAWLVFDPDGIGFDDYFDIHDGMDRTDQLIAFAAGLTPKATQKSYMDLSKVDLSSGAAPSVSLACQLASGVAAAEVTKIITGSGKILSAPHYRQFDCHQLRFVTGKLHFANRGPVQQIKRRVLKHICKKNGVT